MTSNHELPPFPANAPENLSTDEPQSRKRVLVEGVSREEAGRIEAGLRDPAVRAFCVICGVLNDLPSDRARARVLAFVGDVVDEQINDPNRRAAEALSSELNGAAL